MSTEYAFHDDLLSLVTIAPESIVSRALTTEGGARVTLFGFDAGQELSEHTATKPAIIHFLSGEADLVLGTDARTAGPGTWAFMQPNLPHSIRARTPLVMLLTIVER